MERIPEKKTMGYSWQQITTDKFSLATIIFHRVQYTQ